VQVVKAAKPIGISKGQCLCGKIRFEMDTPARWAWHDHSPASRRAHGAAYATLCRSWRKRLRITGDESGIARYEDKATGTAPGFCATCGTPLFYEPVRAPAHDQHPARVARRPYRPGTARSYRNRAAAGVGAFHGDDHYVGMDFVDPPVDFAGVAKSLGMEAIRITDPDQLKSTLSSSFSRPGAKLIEVMVNNAVN
jgi:hypothetical protein